MNPDAGKDAGQSDQGHPDALADLDQSDARANSRHRPTNSKQGRPGDRAFVVAHWIEVEPSPKDRKQQDRKADGGSERQQKARIAEQQHAMEFIEIGKAEPPNRKTEQQAEEQSFYPSAFHFSTPSRRNDTAIATPKKTAVAMRLAGCNRPQPLSPWPEVQPP